MKNFQTHVRFTLMMSLSALAGLTGCGIGSLAPNELPTTAQKGTIHGRMLGGQQPVIGAHVYLFATGTGGYGTASSSLLTSGAGTDSIGTYALSDSNGNFSLTGLYTCTAGAEVYAYALGGNAGAGANSMIGLLAVLGNCPQTGSDLSAQVPTLIINEVSTIAAAYALSGYAVDATHIANSGTTLAADGMYYAGQNAFQLNAIDSANGANSTAPVGGGTVPQALLNTLGNILAACINSTSAASTACASIAANATNGTTAPSDTATAAINIDHAPAANVAALYSLVSATSPFQPTLVKAPADFTVTLTYPNPYLVGAQSIAIDAYNNTWVPSPASKGLFSTSSLGVLTYFVGFPGSIQAPQGIGIDPYGNTWFSDNGTGKVGYFNPRVNGSSVTTYNYAGTVSTFSPFLSLDANGRFATQGTAGGAGELFFSNSSTGVYLGAPAPSPYASSVDSNNFFWVTSNAAGTASGSALLKKYKFNGPYNQINSVTCTGTNYATGTGIVIDSGNNAWVSDSTTSNLVEFSNACAYTNSFPTIHAPTGLAIDGNNTLFTINAANQLGATTTGGTAVSPATGYTLNVTGTLIGPAADSSGNLWFVNTTNGALHVVIGISAPTVTPISLSAFENKLGQRP